MDKIQINANLTLEDWRALRAACARRFRHSESVGSRWLRRLGSLAVFIIIVFSTPMLFDGAWVLEPKSAIVGGVLFFAAMLINWLLALRHVGPAPDGSFLGPCAYRLDGAGLHSSRGASYSFSAWDAVIDVTRTDKHLFVWVDRFSAYVLPCRYLPDGFAAEQFAEWIASAWAGPPARAPTPERNERAELARAAGG